jgi:DNA-binding transcriptional ArsR family regulator
MPSAYLWPHVAVITDDPWLPTLVYPATGIAGIWQISRAPNEALERLLGRTRAVVLTALDEPVSTAALAAQVGLSPGGVSRHLIALRDAGLVSAARHGHQVRYSRTDIGTALLRARRVQ